MATSLFNLTDGFIKRGQFKNASLGREPVSISPLGQGPVVAQVEIRSYAIQGPVIEGTC